LRVAVLVISLCLTLIVGLQSCALYAGGAMIGNQGTASGGAAGILVALLFVLGAAFAIGVPRASIFGLAACIGVGIGRVTSFSDLVIWGFVALALAILSYFGERELVRSKVVK
jgi:hypothetical protein